MQTMADLIRLGGVRRDSLMRSILLVAGGSLLVTLCAKIQVPMWPVPFTMQPFAVLLVGAALGSRRGAAALIAYLVQGAIGLPVFSGPAAGVVYFAGPTGGYLFAFPIAAYLVGRLAERGWDRRFATAVAAFSLGQVTILTLGSIWLSAFIGLEKAFLTGFAQFLPVDVLKILLAAAALPAGWRIVRRFGRC